MNDRSIVISRTIDAPRRRVFEAWTNPVHLAAWWGPEGFSTTTSQFDFRPGGIWRFVMHGPDGRDYENRVTFEEISPPERIAYRHGGGEDVEPVEFRTLVTFEADGAGTRLTLRLTFPNAAERDRVAREYGAEEGGHQTLGRLADYLARGTAGAETVPEFTITRTFDAPRPLVWRAHTEIEHLAKWWGPRGFDWIAGTLDLCPGGLFHYGMRAPDGQEMWGKFTYREIVPMERLVYVSAFSNRDGGTTRAPFAADWPLEVLNVQTLADMGGQTRFELRARPLNATAAEQQRFEAMKPSMDQGFGGTYALLEEYLKTMG